MNWARILSLSSKSLLSFIVMSAANIFVAREYGAAERGNLARMTLVLITIQFVSETGLLGSITKHSEILFKKLKSTNNFARRHLLLRLLISSPILAMIFIWRLDWLSPIEFTFLVVSQVLVTWYQAYTYILQGRNIVTWQKYSVLQSILYAFVIIPIIFTGAEVIYILCAYNCSFILVGYLAKVQLEKGEDFQEQDLSALEKVVVTEYSNSNFFWITANQILNRSDLILFSIILQSTELGIYSVSLSLSMIVSPIFQTLGNIGFIEGSLLAGVKRKSYIFSMVRKYLLISVIVFIPVNLAGFLVYWILLRNDYAGIMQLMPFTFIFVFSKLIVQAVAQILRSSGEMTKGISIQAFYFLSWLALGFIFSRSLQNYVDIVETMAAVSIGCAVLVLCFIRRNG
jgi:hypothetical protein